MSDKGDKYDDLGMLGSYCTSEVQFPNPKGVKTFTGFGADEADLELGFIRPTVRELPNYDKANYHDRFTQPKWPDEDQGNRDIMEQDLQFRTENLRSKGFLTRPRIPTERS